MPLDFLAFNADDLISVGEESEEVKSNEMKLAGDISTINSPADFISTNTLNANQDKNWSKIEDLNNNSNHVNEDLFEWTKSLIILMLLMKRALYIIVGFIKAELIFAENDFPSLIVN